MSDDKFYVYQYLRERASEHGPVGSPFYIGKGTANRAYVKHNGVHLPRDRANIVLIARNLSEDEAFCMEKQLIGFYGRVDIGTGCLLNLTDGGEGLAGRKYTQETRNKIGAAHKGKIVSAETKAKLSEKAKNRKASDEHRAKISESLRNRVITKETRKKLSILGKSHRISEEGKLRISAANKGRIPWNKGVKNDSGI